MSKALNIIPLMAEGGVVMVLLLVSINYVSLRRKQLFGDTLKKFDSKVENVALTVAALFLISFVATAFNVR